MGSAILKNCMSRGFLLDKEMLAMLSEMNEEKAFNLIEIVGTLQIKERVLTKKFFGEYFSHFSNLLENDEEYERFFEKLGKKRGSVTLDNETQIKDENKSYIKLLSAPAFTQRKVVVKDFVNHFRSRYEKIKKIFEEREFDNLTSLRKITDERASFTVIVAVLGKRVTKNKNLFIEVEDPTGNSIILVNQAKKELFEKARNLLEDDIVAFSVMGTKDMLFANDIFYPDGALPEKKYSDSEEYIAFTGDLHAGSTFFLERNINKFLKWLKGEEGDNRQREIAKKVKYIFFTGDNIDGVNHYPGQEKFLTEKTSVGQYGIVERIFKQIPEDKQIIMCPGQHDSVWVGEPQPIIGDNWAPGLHKMKNVHLVPNPSLVEISGGWKILMYHGASINRFIDEIPEIRTNFGHKCPTRVVKEMIKRRHLAPLHGGMDYIPCESGDPLVIETIPDIIVTADQHRAEISSYNNILLIAGSCWQSITPFEEKVGNVPDPCKVPILNLKTREIKILDFSDQEIKWDDGENLTCKIKEAPKIEEIKSEINNCKEKK